jgi:hypothetical protein
MPPCPSYRHGIAARLRRLLRHSLVELPALAARLGVDERELRLSMDERSPRTSVSVLVAVVRHMGVDPTWLITGEYSAHTHHTAMEADGEAAERTVRRLLSELPASSGEWPSMPPSNHLGGNDSG